MVRRANPAHSTAEAEYEVAAEEVPAGSADPGRVPPSVAGNMPGPVPPEPVTTNYVGEEIPAGSNAPPSPSAKEEY